MAPEAAAKAPATAATAPDAAPSARDVNAVAVVLGASDGVAEPLSVGVAPSWALCNAHWPQRSNIASGPMRE